MAKPKIKTLLQLACEILAKVEECPANQTDHEWEHPEGCDKVCESMDPALCWYLYIIHECENQKGE